MIYLYTAGKEQILCIIYNDIIHNLDMKFIFGVYLSLTTTYKLEIEIISGRKYNSENFEIFKILSFVFLYLY